MSGRKSTRHDGNYKTIQKTSTRIFYRQSDTLAKSSGEATYGKLDLCIARSTVKHVADFRPGYVMCFRLCRLGYFRPTIQPWAVDLGDSKPTMIGTYVLIRLFGNNGPHLIIISS